MKKFSNLLVIVVVLGLGMGVAFGSGVTYGRLSAPKAGTGEGARANAEAGNISQPALGVSGGPGVPAQGRLGAGTTSAAGRPTVAGMVESVDAKTLTLTTAQGTSTRVALSDNTAVQRNVGGKVTDLKRGDRVAVMGERGADGALAATLIQILPAGQQ